MNTPLISPFDPAPPRNFSLKLPVATVLAGSLLTLWPLVADFPILPPFGLLMLLGWRLRLPDVFPIWAALPLGLFDDLVSGQPLGSAMLLWTLCFVVIETIDARLVFRDFWQDWLIAAGGVGFCLLAGRYLASPIASHVDTALLLQIAATILLFPVIAWLCAWLDDKREDA